MLMSEKIDVSVIVPVYNAAKYLSQCLDSILHQTLISIEVICIDDGSTDNSLEILKQYQRRNPRLIVRAQKNQFAGIARNNGMKIARGKYLIFWDADDFFAPTALEKMFNKCERDNADICVCGGDKYYEEIDIKVSTDAYLNKKRIPEQIPFNKTTNPDHIINFSTVMIWNKMYRRSFVERNNLCFQDRRNGNDVFFSVCALFLADRITVVDENLVCYRIGRAGSLVSTLDCCPTSPLEAWVDVRNRLISLPDFPKRSFDNKVVWVIRHTFRNVKTWQSYSVLYDYLKNRGLFQLGIAEHNDGYYLSWMNGFLRHLFHDSREDFLVYLMNSGYQKLDEANAKKTLEITKYRNQISKIKSSKSFKLGHFLTGPIRKIKRNI